MTDIRVSVPVDKEKKDFWQDAAKSQGLSFSDFVREALDMKAGFDSVFWKRIKALSKGLHIPEFLVIQNTIIDGMARDAADSIVYGPSVRDLPYFSYEVDENGNAKPITGEQLYTQLLDDYVKEKERTLYRQLMQDKWKAPLSEEDEKKLQELIKKGRAN